MSEEYTFELTPDYEMFYSDSSSFGVYKFNTKSELPHLTGNPDLFDHTVTYSGVLSGRMQKLYLGDTYNVVAKPVYNKKYSNWQYEPISIQAAIPKSEEQQRAFLRSILTEKQTDTLMAVYPNIVEDIMDGKDDVDLSKLNGIGETTYGIIKKKIIDNYVISDILAMLQPLGVTIRTIKSLEKWEANPVLLKKQLMQNPYILTKIRGFGFKKVDTLALKINPESKCSKERLEAYIVYYLQDVGESYGHTWVTMDTLKSNVRDNVIECIDLFDKYIDDDQVKENPLLEVGEGNKIGLKRYYNVEEYIFNKVTEMKNIEPIAVTEDNINDGLKEAEDKQGFELTEEQRDVVINALKNNITIISGKAGSGKSSTVRSILTIYSKAGYQIGCCALSAKAAMVIRESTGFPATTIHRMLGCQGANKFKYNKDNPLPFNVLFIDEGSMISADIFYLIFQAIKSQTKLIICGDNGQLPPIGYGNIFNDLLGMREYLNGYELTKVMRQAADSGITSDANVIRSGNNPINKPELKIVTGKLKDMTYMFRDDRDVLNKLAIKAYMGAIKTYGVDDVLIGVPRKKDCVNSTGRINEAIQELLLPDETRMITYGTRKYKLGAKVIQKVNNYEKNVFNGDVGYITDISTTMRDGQKMNTFTVEYKSNEDTKTIEYEQGEIDQIDLAYAMTIHSLQGSGYKAVIIVIDNTHFALLDNCLLYTAITRAKKKCLLLAEPYAFKKCISENKTTKRQTWFENFFPF